MVRKKDLTWVEDGVLTRPVHIVCSPFKTGTTSIGDAILKLGVGARMMPYRHAQSKEFLKTVRPLTKLIGRGQSFADFKEEHGAQVKATFAPLIGEISGFDVFHDAPFGHPHIHPFLRKVIAPQAKFIWVNRPFEDWLDSVRRWELSHPDIYPKHTQWAEDLDLVIRRRTKHWNKSYARFKRMRRNTPDDCLELDWQDLTSFEALAEFYGVDRPEGAFPKRNVSKS